MFDEAPGIGHSQRLCSCHGDTEFTEKTFDLRSDYTRSLHNLRVLCDSVAFF